MAEEKRVMIIGRAEVLAMVPNNGGRVATSYKSEGLYS